MFGRRNPDRPLDTPPAANNSHLNLDMLADLPDIPTAEASQPAPAQPPAQAEGALVLPASPAMQPPHIAEAPVPTAEPAGHVTQKLPAIDLEPAFAAVHDQLWGLEPEAAPAPGPLAPAEEAHAWQPLKSAPEAAAEAGPAAPPAPAQLPARASAESLIGPDDFFDGHYRSERGVRIQGNARGSIESRQYILVEAGAQVEADLAAEEIVVAGTISGKVACRGRLEIMDTGAVQGTIETATLVVHEGGTLDGELHMRRAEG